MANVSPETNADPKSDRSLCHEQFPVDARIWKIRFDSPLGDFVRIVVMSGLSTPQNTAYKEYNYNDPVISIHDVSSFVMRGAPLEKTQDIEGFVGTMSQQFAIPQSATWYRGIHSPAAARTRLYKATDPDDTTKMLGVLIEQDAQGRLAQLTWYKTRDASVLFQATPAALTFEMVKNEAGMPSTDPNDIGGWTWYFTTSLRATS